METKLIISSIMAISLLGSGYAFSPKSGFILDNLADLALSKTEVENQAPVLDKVTFVLVDTTLFLMQLGKTGLGYSGFIDEGYLLDFVYNVTRTECVAGNCWENKIFMEFRDQYISGVDTIKLYTNFQPDSLEVRLTVDDLNLDINGYRHTITNEVSNNTRVGEGASLRLRNAVYSIKANYSYVPEVGIQLSNVNLTLDIGSELWTINRRYVVLENGFIVDEGLYVGNLAEDVMSIWKGEYEGKPFEEQYEQWAQTLLNCGLSGAPPTEECSGVKEQLKEYKLRNFPAA